MEFGSWEHTADETAACVWFSCCRFERLKLKTNLFFLPFLHFQTASSLCSSHRTTQLWNLRIYNSGPLWLHYWPMSTHGLRQLLQEQYTSKVSYTKWPQACMKSLVCLLLLPFPHLSRQTFVLHVWNVNVADEACHNKCFMSETQRAVWGGCRLCGLRGASRSWNGPASTQFGSVLQVQERKNTKSSPHGITHSSLYFLLFSCDIRQLWFLLICDSFSQSDDGDCRRFMCCRRLWAAATSSREKRLHVNLYSQRYHTYVSKLKTLKLVLTAD